jgi:hypothetical protein
MFGSVAPTPQPMAMGGLFGLGGLAGAPGGGPPELAYMQPPASVPGMDGAWARPLAHVAGGTWQPPHSMSGPGASMPRGPLGGWLEKSAAGQHFARPAYGPLGQMDRGPDDWRRR